LGALIQAVSLRIFFVPADLASGGVSGIAQLINHFTGWPIGLMILIGNVPLFALGWRFLGGHRFALRTATAVIIYSLFTDLLTYMPFFPQNGLTDDVLLNALYGAILSGFGYGLVYRARGTSGGSDILARILNKWRTKELPVKNTPYECGMLPVGDGSTRMSVKFYLVAMIFLLFDIEVAFLGPWAMALRDLGWAGFVQILTFFLILSVGFIYVWRKGVLDWGAVRRPRPIARKAA